MDGADGENTYRVFDVKSAWLMAEQMTKQSDGRGTSHEGVVVGDERCVRQGRKMVAGW